MAYNIYEEQDRIMRVVTAILAVEATLSSYALAWVREIRASQLEDEMPDRREEDCYLLALYEAKAYDQCLPGWEGVDPDNYSIA